MPELRKDPVTGRWVIIATDRAKRPTDFVRDRVQIRGSGFCPFCPGNESKTPPEILAYRSDGSARNTPGWSLRVVPNKFPALGIEGTLNRQGEGMYDKMNGIGAHEVIIESPRHDLTLATLPARQVEDVLWSYRDRIIDLKKDRRFKYILIFANHDDASEGLPLSTPTPSSSPCPSCPSGSRKNSKGRASTTISKSSAYSATSSAKSKRVKCG